MKIQKAYLFLAISFLGSLAGTQNALGDQPTLIIESPSEAPEGSEIPIEVTVVHSANHFFHHVAWVEVRVNGRQVFWREYAYFNLPEGATFTIEIKQKVNGVAYIRAEASCNLDGTRGPAFFIVSAKE